MHKTKPIRHSSRFFLLTGSLLLVTAAVGLGAAAEPSARKPNFIFILTDDMSWADVACFGHPYAKTPNVDRMAKEGIKFTQFYACAQECAPARSALLTGRLPAKAGKLTNNGPGLDPAVPNVNKLLKTAGYATGHFGKWHLAHGFKDLPVTNSLSEYGIDESWLASNNGHNADTAASPRMPRSVSSRHVLMSLSTCLSGMSGRTRPRIRVPSRRPCTRIWFSTSRISRKRRNASLRRAPILISRAR